MQDTLHVPVQLPIGELNQSTPASHIQEIPLDDSESSDSVEEEKVVSPYKQSSFKMQADQRRMSAIISAPMGNLDPRAHNSLSSMTESEEAASEEPPKRSSL